MVARHGSICRAPDSADRHRGRHPSRECLCRCSHSRLDTWRGRSLATQALCDFLTIYRFHLCTNSLAWLTKLAFDNDTLRVHGLDILQICIESVSHRREFPPGCFVQNRTGRIRHLMPVMFKNQIKERLQIPVHAFHSACCSAGRQIQLESEESPRCCRFHRRQECSEAVQWPCSGLEWALHLTSSSSN